MNTEYKVNKGQIAKIHVLLGQIGMAKDKEYKEGLVREYTDGRETSTTGLTWKEAKDMIAGLEQRAGSRERRAGSGERGAGSGERKGDRKRKLILHYAHEMGWVVDHSAPAFSEAMRKARDANHPKVDMDRVNAWCVKYGYLHKPLMEYSVAELSKLVVQMERAYMDHLWSV